jgi:hypothetical protein
MSEVLYNDMFLGEQTTLPQYQTRLAERSDAARVSYFLVSQRSSDADDVQASGTWVWTAQEGDTPSRALSRHLTHTVLGITHDVEFWRSVQIEVARQLIVTPLVLTKVTSVGARPPSGQVVDASNTVLASAVVSYGHTALGYLEGQLVGTSWGQSQIEQVTRAVLDSPYDFRTAESVSEDTGISLHRVEEILSNSERIRRSPATDGVGRILFTSVSKPVSWRERYAAIRERVATW